MINSKDDKFNDTLKRMMAQEPKPQEEMKKGRSQSRTSKKEGAKDRDRNRD